MTILYRYGIRGIDMGDINNLLKVVCCGSCVIALLLSIVGLKAARDACIMDDAKTLTAYDIYTAMITEDGIEP